MITSNSIFEFVGIIPMNKESIFEEETPSTETAHITRDLNEWYTSMFNRLQTVHVDGINYNRKPIVDLFDVIPPTLQEIFDLSSSFMTGPVALFKGRVLTAKTRKASSLEEIRDILITERLNGNTLFLYELSFTPKTTIETRDPITFASTGVFVEADEAYYIRYDILGE